MRTHTWLGRRGIRVHGVCMGVLDMREKNLYLADLVGERHGRLLLGVVYCSSSRAQVRPLTCRPSKLAYV